MSPEEEVEFNNQMGMMEGDLAKMNENLGHMSTNMNNWGNNFGQ